MPLGIAAKFRWASVRLSDGRRRRRSPERVMRRLPFGVTTVDLTRDMMSRRE